MLEIFSMGFKSASSWMLRLVAAVAIAVAGLILGVIMQKVVKKVLHEFEINKVLKAQGLTLPLEEFISEVIKYFIYLIGIILALVELGLATEVMEAILLFILIMISIFIILAFKDFIPNIMAGFFLHQRGTIKPGDYIRISSVEGKVVEIDFMETRIKVKNGDLMIVPNSVLIKNQVVKLNKKR